MCSIILKIKAFVLFNSRIYLIFSIISISFLIVYLVRHYSHAFFRHVFNSLDLKFLFNPTFSGMVFIEFLFLGKIINIILYFLFL